MPESAVDSYILIILSIVFTIFSNKHFGKRTILFLFHNGCVRKYVEMMVFSQGRWRDTNEILLLFTPSISVKKQLVKIVNTHCITPCNGLHTASASASGVIMASVVAVPRN